MTHNLCNYTAYIACGVTQDRAQGLAWWRKAADQGDALAVHCLGHARDAGGSEPVA